MAQDLNEFIELDPGLRQIHTSSSMMAAGGTSGVSSTVIEMQPMGSSSGGYPQHAAKLQQSSTSLSPSKSSSPARSSHHAQQRSGSRTASRPTDLASFDSSDTWASCQPFPSITDLAVGSAAGGCWSPSSSQPGASASSFHSAEIQGNQQIYVKPVANNNGSRAAGNENDDDEDNNENSQLLSQTEVQSNQNPVRSSKVFEPLVVIESFCCCCCCRYD